MLCSDIRTLQFAPLLAEAGCEACDRIVPPWSLLRKNITAINLQTFTSRYGSRRFSTCDQGYHCGVFTSRSAFFSRPWCSCLFMNVFNNTQVSLYYSVCMRTSGEKVRMSDEAERAQSISYLHIRSLSGLCIRIMLLALMPIEETAETRVRTDYLNFYVSQCRQIKTQISFREEGIGIIFLWDFRSRCSSKLHKIS